jgi:hypothetical protein
MAHPQNRRECGRFSLATTMNVVADKKTLTEEDFARVRELLNVRPIQFCMFLKALLGTEEMERLMIHAISVAKQIGEG